MMNSTIKIPWFIPTRFIKWYMKRQMDKQPDIIGEDEFISTITETIDIMPSCKAFEEYCNIQLNLKYGTIENLRDKYIEEILKPYRKELRDWYNKRKELRDVKNSEN